MPVCAGRTTTGRDREDTTGSLATRATCRSELPKHVKTGKNASKRESMRAIVLRNMQACGIISELEEQVKYELIPKQEGERAVTYTCDFRYKDIDGNIKVEDSKGFKTQQYIIRRKLMLWVHGIKVWEV